MSIMEQRISKSDLDWGEMSKYVHKACYWILLRTGNLCFLSSETRYSTARKIPLAVHCWI